MTEGDAEDLAVCVFVEEGREGGVCCTGVYGRSYGTQPGDGAPRVPGLAAGSCPAQPVEDLCSSQELVPDSPEQGFHGAAGVGSRERSQEHTRLCAASPGAQLAPPARPGEQSPGSSDY